MGGTQSSEMSTSESPKGIEAANMKAEPVIKGVEGLHWPPLEAGLVNRPHRLDRPLEVAAQGPSAQAEAAPSWDYTGANVGASLGEARARPVAALQARARPIDV